MSINSIPTVLQPAIQTNYLNHEFDEALKSKFKFRSVAQREVFPNGDGETVTRSRPGQLAPVTALINGSANTNFDNGMTPVNYGMEQYTAKLGLLSSTMDLNIETAGVAIVDLFIQNAKALAYNAAQSMDRQAQAALYAAAMYGATRVRVTATTPFTTIALDDVRGFLNTWSSSGVPTAVSGSNTLAITLNGNPYTVNAASVDGTNVSSCAALGGQSGTITLTSAATPADVTVTSGVGTTALASYATTVLRPNGRSNTSALVAGDILTMGNLLDATAQLRNNAIDGVEGDAYVVFLTPSSMRQIFKDPDFKQLYQGDSEKSETFKDAVIYKLAGLIFVVTTDVPAQVLNGVTVLRPIVVGKGALVEMIAEALMVDSPFNIDGVAKGFDGIRMVTRPALDRLGQWVAQSWMSIFAFVCPTDVSVLQSVIPTASASAYKRVVMIEHTLN